MKTVLPVVLILLFCLLQVGDATPAYVPPGVGVQGVTSQRLEVKDSFRVNLLKAIQSQRQAGKITVKEAMQLRLATLSPAFLQRAHELAVIQISCSGEVSEFVPTSEDGVVQVEGINWDGLIKFMEAFIPLLITLLKAFGI